MASDAIVSIGVQKFWDLLSQEYELFQGVEDQVAELKSDLDLLKSFLKDADSKKHTSALVRHCVDEIKEIVYDAEDVIESFLLKETLGKTGIKNRIRKLACIVPDRRGFASYIGGISKRISRVIRNMQSFGVQQKIEDGSMQREMRQTFSEDYDSDLVGLEAKVTTLLGYLVEKDDIQIVSITGMGGLGKTTLARQVFNHEMVKNKFDGLVWVCVSQDFVPKNVWQKILQNLTSKERKEEIQKMDEDELKKEFIQILKTSKPLIVFDDIWKDEDWGEIKQIFPPKEDWKVLLTSRNDSVAMHEASHFNFKPDILNDLDSWTLFERIAMPRKDDSEYEVYEKWGKEMVKHCKGLPLAVKALGGLLKTVRTVPDWERLSTNIGSHNVIGRTSANNNSIDRVLSMSFEELPGYLKHCFLYLAHFPEDYEIDVEDLAYYWAAEGIPRPRYYDGATIRQVADGYIEELVKRNIVISKRDVRTSRFETCQLHDVMREVCLLRAEEENFVHIVEMSTSTTTSQSPCKSRRIAVHQPDKNYDRTWEFLNPKLRSLLIIQNQSSQESWMASSLCFTRLQLMRVLDLSFAKFKGGKLPSSIGDLIHLRYLSLFEAMVTHLPSSMRNLKQLLYLNLDLDSSRSPVYMPNFLKEMQNLAYLSLPSELDDKTKLELGNLVNLETLKRFSTKHSSVEDLQRMTKLRNLYIYIEGKGCTVKILSSSLGELRHLEVLTIKDYTNDEEGFVLDCVHLKKLKLRIYMPELPDEQRFPSHLRTIILENCCLVKDPMPILEKLVQLKGVELRRQSFIGRRMVCSRGGFPQLQELKIWGLKEWEEWIVEEGSMPLLHSLFIRDCPKLKMLGQHFPSNVTNIFFWECPSVEDPMPILEKLLHLKEVSLYKSFCGRRMVCSGGGFPQLQELTIWGLNNWEEWIVEEGCMPLLHSLHISECPKLKKLPDGQHFPSNLTIISFLECPLVEDPMPIIEKLLHLKEVRLYKSFCGRRMVCSDGGFPQLQELYLDGLDELEEWIVEEGSMPLLHFLYVCNCAKLKKLPDGQHFPSNLTIISFLECPLVEDPMPILEKLLHLKEVRLYKSLCGRRMVCSDGGFPQLHSLYLNGLEEWEEWIVEEGSMPLLHSLIIYDCPKLQGLPERLKVITSLKDITVEGEIVSSN